MQRVPMMDCGDGTQRADNGCRGKVAAKTASYTINPAEAGTLYTNRGAAGSVTFTLPPPKAGMWFGFQKAVNNQNIVVVTDVAATKFDGLTQGTTATNSTTEFGAIRIWSDGVVWFVDSQTGTWGIS